VQTLPGFTSINYHVYSIEKTDESRVDKEAVSLEDILASLGSQLRARKYLTFTDPGRRALWIFRGENNTGFADGRLDEGFADPVKGISLKCESTACYCEWLHIDTRPAALFKGSLKAAELSQCFSRPPVGNNSPSTPTGVSPSTPTAALRAAQLANLRAHQQGAGALGGMQEPATFPPAPDARTIYALFMNAVSSTISYHLARHHNTFHLDSRTFVAVSKPLLHEDENAPTPSLMPFTLDIYLTAGGNLVISTGIDHVHQLRTLHEPRDDAYAVYLAVGGLSAELLEEPSSSADADSLAWKDLVKERLELRGICLGDIDSELRWVLVRASPSAADNSGDAMVLSTAVFYWPAALCFYDDRLNSYPSQSYGGTTDREGIDETNPSSWFTAPEHGGFTDPLRFAEDWFRSKAERDKIIEERRQRQRDLEASQKQADGAAINVPSPFYTRGDLQSAGGVYPTPPDGLPQASSVAMAPDVPAIAGTNASARPSVDYQAGEGMDLDMSEFGQGVKLRGPSVISRESMQLDTAIGLGDDLFGDMDEDDDFVGNDITDADFSFFDEPDLADEDMLRGPSSVAAIPPDDEMDPLAITDGKEIKIEVEPTDSVDTALQDNKHALILTDDKDVLRSDPIVDDVLQRTPAGHTSSSPEAVASRAPLSPTSVRKKLFDSAIEDKNDSHQKRRPSTFDPISFGSGLGKTDAKYAVDGAFSFVPPDPSTNLKRLPDKAFNISLPPRKKRARVAQPAFPGGQLVVVRNEEWDSEQSSVTSDASDEDSMTEFGEMSIATSPMKPYHDKRLWELQDEEATSVATSPGIYMSTDDGFAPAMTGTRKVLYFPSF
jgi:mediator of RNA polymerase II transcription subunit 13